MNRRPFIKTLGLGATFLASSGLFAHTVFDDRRKRTIKPKRLTPGDTITLIAPGGPVTEEKIAKAEKNLQELGFKTKQSKNLRAQKKHTAGTDQQRLEDLHTAFADTNSKAIWCVRGGDGCNRLLPYLDYNLIKNNPKPLIGFSDITALSNAIYHKTGLIGFHGPIGAWNFSEYTVAQLTKVLMETKSDQIIKGTERTSVITDGKARGILVGGNLSLLAALAGTPYDHDYTNKIVFIEDVGEAPRRIDRMLTQLSQSSNLKKASGIIFGEFADCYDPTLKNKLEDELETNLINLTQNSASGADKQFLSKLQTKLNEEIKAQQIQTKLDADLKETITDRFLKGLKLPVLYDFPFSHDSSKEFCTFPVGIEAELDATNKQVILLENAVI
ncbi:LD-carboxypeptidase [Flavobacteriaceae bacterium M23B6Z8]